jgi:pyruvate/2-oxoglutarate dehydrogenase complex dihydrolipoamide dehydrogenase (E3) component
MYDLIVLGGGAGGLNVATAAAAVGAKVALIEKDKLGGECTHSACVPSKALIQAARLAHQMRTAHPFGVRAMEIVVDFRAVMDRVRRVVAGFAGADSGESLRARGIDVIHGSPAFEAYDTVVVDGRTRLNAHRFVIATGSRPAVPPIPGLAESGYLDNNTIWGLDERPESLAILGGGPVGIEFGQALARLGTKVTILDAADRILPREEPEVSERVRSILAAEGIAIHTGVEVTGVALKDGQKVVKFRNKARETFEASRAHLLVATGRLANVEGLNLEAVGIHADPQHGIEVDEYLTTHTRHILAIGDVIGHHQWTHAAEREAAVAFQNAVLRLSKRIDYAAIPWATFTDPEVATVGLTEAEARARDPDVRVFRVELADVDRPRIDGLTDGLAKVVAAPSGKVLGATIVGPEASAVLQEFVLAMEHGLTLMDIANAVHPYPSYGGVARKLANQFVATKLEKGYVQTALRWFYGFRGRPDGGPAKPEPTPAAVVGHAGGPGH